MNVSEGGTIELPCMKGAFPDPTIISWWRNENQCDSVQCLVSDNLTSTKLLAAYNTYTIAICLSVYLSVMQIT